MYNLENIERPSLLVKRIVENAMTKEELKARNLWPEKDKTQPCETKADTFVGITAGEAMESVPMYSGKLTTQLLFSSLYTSLIYGNSGAGKSWLALFLAVCLAVGREFLGFVASSPIRVGVMNGELADEIGDRLRKLAEAMKLSPEEEALLKNNIIIFPAEQCYGFIDKSEELAAALIKSDIRLLIVDNVLALRKC